MFNVGDYVEFKDVPFNDYMLDRTKKNKKPFIVTQIDKSDGDTFLYIKSKCGETFGGLYDYRFEKIRSKKGNYNYEV